MTLPYTHSVRTYKTVSVGESSSPTLISTAPSSATLLSSGPSTPTLLSSTPIELNEGTTTYRTLNLSGAQLQPVQCINTAMDAGNVVYGSARYLVPVQQRPAESQIVYLSQAPRVVSPMYIQNVQPVSVATLDESDVYRQVSFNGQASSVISQTSSPIKSPEPSETELVESFREDVLDLKDVKNCHSTQIRTEVIDVEPVAKLDNRFFGELLAEVYRKNCDIQTCISEHVAKIRGRKHLLDPTIDYKVEKEEIEALIPKGVSELTKQQIRYLLQTRMTADKTMRLLLSTFSSLREELVHLQDDLRRLESEKDELERDLSFKADQALQYDRLLESVREHNRQLQVALKDSNNSQRTVESQLLTYQSKDPSKDFRIKELEGSKRTLEQENDLLRKKLAGQCNSSTLQIKTQELSRQYEQMLSDLREEKERELNSLRSQMIKIQTERTITQTSDPSIELRITELLSKLEQRDTVIRHQEEELKRLRQDKTNSSSNVTRTVVTKRYMNQYPILGLLSDDYQYTGPVKEDKTVIIETTGGVTKQA